MKKVINFLFGKTREERILRLEMLLIGFLYS